ncbi:MAG: efflux transporter outer membrane subunit [Verrucomicrobiales bacterium]|nr:efflux transporter outer membrane subunit [Verrucomicrobiales bacterium]
MNFRFYVRLASAALGLLQSSCLLGPKGELPAAAEPSAFKGAAESGSVERPMRPEWWTVFHDARLDALAERIEGENLQLRAALARVDQAYAALGVDAALRVPRLDGAAGATRNRASKGGLGGGFFGVDTTQYRAGLLLDWEVDLWGRVRRLVEARQAEATEAEALAEDVKLALQAELVRNYFALRFTDAEAEVLEGAVQTRLDNLELAQRRFQGGVAAELDVARAETELAATRAEAARLAGTRTRLENAIAVLVGQAPSEFHLPVRPLSGAPPQLRAGLPVEALSNRPDIAASQQRLVAANARIGVATAEFFPKLSLIGNGGYSSLKPDTFLLWSSRTYSIGPSVSIPMFQGGRLRMGLKRARAEQAEAVADYQQAVLVALREVEDALGDLGALRREIGAQEEAVRSAQRAVALSTKRYEEGLVSSIEVVDAVREQLTAERRAVQVRAQQHEATVRLIQALGGGVRATDVSR